MPALSDLKQKWFIDVSNPSSGFPPSNRNSPSTSVKPFTDGNVVVPLIDGSVYMAKIRDSILQLPANSDIWFVGWELDNVAVLGQKDTTALNRAIAFLTDAYNRQISVCGLVSQHLGPSYPLNVTSIINLRFFQGLSSILFDARFPPPLGSHHQKFYCIRDAQNAANSHVLLGSMDLTRSRWDRSLHLPTDPDREFPGGLQDAKSTHDLGIMIKGPAIADIEATFLERWNDPSTISIDLTQKTPLKVPFKITKSLTAQPAMGSQSVQVLRTFGCFTHLTPLRYSWSNTGEFTIWASYLNAIKNARKFIYLEDQYFIPFGSPPFCEAQSPSRARDTDLFYQLGEALKQGVKILAVVPHKSEDPGVADSQNYQRAIGIKFLRDVLKAGAPGDLLVVSLLSGTEPVFVHSKTMIVDDEFAIVGTNNFNQRSMTSDSEIALGIVDAQNDFAKGLRTRLWAEHLEVPLADVDNPLVGYNLFKIAAGRPGGSGRVRGYDESVPNKSLTHNYLMRFVIDPYSGPER